MDLTLRMGHAHPEPLSREGATASACPPAAPASSTMSPWAGDTVPREPPGVPPHPTPTPNPTLLYLHSESVRPRWRSTRAPRPETFALPHRQDRPPRLRDTQSHHSACPLGVAGRQFSHLQPHTRLCQELLHSHTLPVWGHLPERLRLRHLSLDSQFPGKLVGRLTFTRVLLTTQLSASLFSSKPPEGAAEEDLT